MTSSSEGGGRGGFRNVPPPPGSKAATAYSRFIPREELGEVSSWKPGSFGRRATDRPGAAPETHAPGAAAGATPATPAAPSAEDWAARVQAARQAGYQDGYRDGLSALENFKQTFASQATAQIGGLLDAFDRQLNALDERLAEHLARAAMQLARHVVRSELSSRPALVAQVAAEAVQAVMLSARHIGVSVHPEDLPLVAEGAEEALAARGARLVADPTIERGGVIVHSDVGTVDARIAERWAQAAGLVAPDVEWVAADPASQPPPVAGPESVAAAAAEAGRA